MADDHHHTGQNGTGQNNTNGHSQNGNGQNTNGHSNIGQAGVPAAKKVKKCTCEFPRVNIDDDGKEDGIVNKVARSEFLKTADGIDYSRPHVCDANPNAWKIVIPPVRAMTPPKDKKLWVVRQTQVDKGPHWSLFAAIDDNSDTPQGRIWQVNGDPDVGMRYAHRPPEDGVAIFLTRSFLDSVLISESLNEDEEAELDKIANTIKPPGPSETDNEGKRRKIDFRRGTCRTWVWDVLDQLVGKGIASSDVVAQVKALQPGPVV